MNGASGVTRVRSVSSTGLSIVYVEFEWGTNIYENRQIVAERLAQSSAICRPASSRCSAPISSLMGEIMLIGMSSDTVDPMALREIADWVVAPRLKAMPGVSRVVPIGGLVRQYPRHARHAAHVQLGITLDDTGAALGAVRHQHRRRLRQPGRPGISDPQPLAHARSRGSAQPRRRPCATASRSCCARSPMSASSRSSAAAMPAIMGSPGVIISVQKQPTADTVALTSQIEAVLADLQRDDAGGRAGRRVSCSARRISSTPRSTIIEQVLIEAIVSRGDHPLPVPVQLPHDVHLADRHPALGAHDLHRLRAGWA